MTTKSKITTTKEIAQERPYLKPLCDIIDAQQAEIDELKKNKENKKPLCGRPTPWPRNNGNY